MTIIAARPYRDGRPIDLTASGPRTSGEFDWAGLYEPSAEEIARVGVRYGLHPLAIEDALSTAQQPKVETFGDTLFVVAKTAEIDRLESIVYSHTAMFVGHDFIVTGWAASARTTRCAHI